MHCQCSDVMEASCSDGWWAFWMGVIGTWLPVYGVYRVMLHEEEESDDEVDPPPKQMYS